MTRLLVLGCLLGWCLGALGCGKAPDQTTQKQPPPRSRLKKPMRGDGPTRPPGR